MLTNYHSHTQFCDGRATMEELILEAIRLGFKQWGISPHSPLPMLKQAPWAISIDQVDEYISEAKRLKERYKDKIEVLIGMEIDYIDDSYNPSSSYFQSLDLDFRIGSIHLLKSELTGEIVDIDCPVAQFKKTVDYHFNGSLQRIVQAYYKASKELVLVGGYDFIAHSDKISGNSSELSRNITQKAWYKDLVEEYLQLCASRNVVMEINTKAFETRGRFFPDLEHFKRMTELDIEVVINSDVHRLERMQVGLMEARELYTGKIRVL